MTIPTPTFDICIHGAGFVGRTLALLLVQQGLRVALLSNEGSSVGAPAVDIRAFALNSASKDLLSSVNAWPADRYVTPVLTMHVFGDAKGRVQLDTPQHAKALSWIVDVPALEAALTEQVAGEPRIVCLAKGEVCTARLHAACEGRDAKMTEALGVVFETIRYPQHAVAARLVGSLAHGNAARQWFNERGEVLALLPMRGSAEASGQEVALVWSLESSRAKEMLGASDADFCTALEAASNFALGNLQLTSMRALWPLQLTRTSHWTGQSDEWGAWVIAGDAAHTVHPLAGQGLNLGLGDAALLAQTLQKVQGASPLFRPTQTQLSRALQSYARARQAAAASVAGVTDGLHLLFARESAWIASARNVGMSWLDRAAVIKNFLIKKAQK